jgi:cyclopropane fatty-acyl-phospholipid synthase-like methyltransferase
MDIKQNLIKSYNNHAGERDKNKQQEWKIETRNLFFEKLKKENKETLLDIGAGTGVDSKFFMENNFDVMAVDFSEEMIKICKKKYINSIQLDFENLHKLGKKFDAIWSMNSLLHVEKLKLNLVLKEIKSILNPNGLFFMGVYGGEDSEGFWEKDKYTPSRFFSFYTDENIKKIVSCYFEIVSFNRIETGEKYHFQAIIMKNK